MRVLVIGGTGLISTAIVDRLIEVGHTPILFNRGQTPPRFQANVEVLHGDRQDFDAFSNTMATVDVDAVIDMITFDARTASNGIDVFRERIGHYLFCSTVCVYGGPLDTVPADESEPHTPVSGYGRNKSAAEQTFMTAHRDHGFPVTIFRPSHCYGPGKPLLDIFGYNPALVPRIRANRPILVPGDGYGLWQPGYVGDVAKGFVGALNVQDAIGQAYNVVGDEIMDWRTFHRTMAEAMDREANIVPMTTAQIVAGAPAEVDTSMLREIFQYHGAFSNAKLKAHVPEYTNLLPYFEGVKRTVAWLDETAGHAPEDSQAWIDTLVEREQVFRAGLAAHR